MSSAAAAPATAEVNPLNPKGLKPYVCAYVLADGRCCACPETKAVRDDCFLKNAPEVADEKCRAVVEAHKACMRSYGFKV